MSLPPSRGKGPDSGILSQGPLSGLWNQKLASFSFQVPILGAGWMGLCEYVSPPGARQAGALWADLSRLELPKRLPA